MLACDELATCSWYTLPPTAGDRHHLPCNQRIWPELTKKMDEAKYMTIVDDNTLDAVKHFKLRQELIFNRSMMLS